MNLVNAQNAPVVCRAEANRDWYKTTVLHVLETNDFYSKVVGSPVDV